MELRHRRILILATSAVLCGGAMAATAAPAADAEALARAAIAESKLPDPGGATLRKLAGAVRALPAWLPWYPGARLGLDSAPPDGGVLQLGFSSTDSEARLAAFYLERLRARGTPTDLREAGVRTIEVSNASGTQITSVILMPRAGGGVTGLLKHEGPLQ
jgi:hypothetical protein